MDGSYYYDKGSDHLEGIEGGISAWLSQRKRFYEEDVWNQMMLQLKNSTTLYVGNLSFFTTEKQIYSYFGRVGPVKKVIIGLNKEQKTPCGFCFVEYYDHKTAVEAQRVLSGTKLDDRYIRADLDPGFTEGPTIW